MEPKLFQLKSELDLQNPIELCYYGIDLQKLNDLFRGRYFCFIQVPSIRYYIKPVIKKIPTKVPDNIVEIKQDVFIQIRKLLIDLSPEFNSISVQDFTAISVEEFNPTGFYKEDYQKVSKLIESDKLKDKLMKLADDSPSLGKADLKI